MATNFTPTPTELAFVNQIFNQADTQKLGILTGDVAVKILGGSKLAPTVLGEIWNIADEDNNGFLTKKGLAIALRLIGHAQRGDKVQKSLLGKPGPLAAIEGVQAPLVPQGTGMSIPKSPPPILGLPPLTTQDRTRFIRLFQSCGPVDGLLSGDKARDTFMKSKLSVDKLSQIWSLCDTQDRGSLDSTDFTIAMYLIQASMSNKLSFIPTTLPPGLYEQASGAVVPQATGGSAHLGSPASSPFPSPLSKQMLVQPQFTGQMHNAPPALPSRRPQPVAHTPAIPSFQPVAAPPHWDITPVEKAASDRFFDTLDTLRRGYIEGEVAVPFMLQSKLPEETLAQVWDLADINSDGRLTRDGFAVAMHLIQGKLSGKDIPSTLPPTLVPPSMRTPVPSFSAPPNQLSEPLRDLLWDDSTPSSAMNTQPQPQSASAQVTRHIPTSSATDPFGAPTVNSPFNKDLLGDDDDTHTSPPLHDQSAEIGNLQNQFSSTNKTLQSAKVERESLETTLATQAAQLSALQTQLASAKASFETETALLGTLRERHAAQTAEIQKVREELIRGESDLSAVRVEKAELEGSFLRDKEEVRELNKKMMEVTGQIATTKQEVEKVKKEAKQQKGLLAIARKQFASKESEKAKVDKELEEAQSDLADITKEREEAAAEVTTAVLPAVHERARSPMDSLSFAAAQPLPLTPDLTGTISPGNAKSNNPFDKLAKSAESSTPRSQSPLRSFSAASVPIGSSLFPSATITDNPFSFVQALEGEQQQPPVAAPDTDATERVTTPRPSVDFNDAFASPISEHFDTPNSGTPVANQSSDPARIASLDIATSHFPALDNIPEQSSERASEQETDLSTDLQDLDVEDSDSDSDRDEDTNEEATQDDAQTAVGAQTSELPLPSTAPISFDDIFGPADSGAASSSAPTTKSEGPLPSTLSAVDAFGAPLEQPAESTQSALSSFDEAFGKAPTTGPSQPSSTFSFDTAFDDNFDFGSASAAAATAAMPATHVVEPSAVAPVNGNAQMDKAPTANGNGIPGLASQPGTTGAFSAPSEIVPQQSGASVSFESAFTGPWNAGPVAESEKAGINPPNQPNPVGISFEEAFGGLDSSQALKLDNSFSSRSSKAFTLTASPSSTDAGKPFPAMSPPTSPLGPSSPRVVSGRSASPHRRAASPPPRVASPKTQRSSTSSSRDVAHEKPALPARHSKLSLRLPFGKKKKHDQAPPLPPSSLAHQATPIMEQNGSPGAEDDVRPVKQLIAMGFSREQAVTALEAYDYDVQRALNSLLGAQ
ncbi:hypothetical protein V8B97DRAFT_1951878 [Scleroderma yunnanense]